jgi:ubiquinone/menaquinone biosynthesis C-methylase UbiE
MNTKDMSAHWNEQAQIYASDDGHHEFNRFLDLYEQCCWEYIKPALPAVEGSLILEAGCGTGRWVKRLAPMGYRMVLSDLSTGMVDQARKKVEASGFSEQIEGYYALDICDMHALCDSTFDMVLTLGGPLTLCRDASEAIGEFFRVTKPGGYVVCDVANRYRTAMNLVSENDHNQFTTLLNSGTFARPDGLSDHRFEPQEFIDLFTTNRLEVIHLAGVCPFFDFLPTKDHVRILENEEVFRIMREIGKRTAENPYLVGLSGRLLIVARRLE